MMMGCKYCSSGLGKFCEGPLGLDDLEVNCHCECHCCSECGSAYCESMGGHESCETDEDETDEDETDEDIWEGS